ncbi:MAG TPA: hypothetical protein PKB15_02905 [Acidimicrobiia bacterium]|nr:hypothetical protein [Acidimicrobiia bacterium]
MLKKLFVAGSGVAVAVCAVVLFKKKQNQSFNAIVESTYTDLREWNSSLQREIVRSHRDARDVCIAVLRINDSAKKENSDTFSEIEKNFINAVRGSDLLAHSDNGEFYMLFPEAGLDEGYEAVERLQETLPPTASLAAGIAVWDHCETAAELVARTVASMQGEERTSRAKIAVAETPQGSPALQEAEQTSDAPPSEHITH